MSVDDGCVQEWQIVQKTKVKTVEGGSACILQQTCERRGQKGCQWKQGNITQAYAGPNDILENVATGHTTKGQALCLRNIR